jgi:hypothetical protein
VAREESTKTMRMNTYDSPFLQKVMGLESKLGRRHLQESRIPYLRWGSLGTTLSLFCVSLMCLRSFECCNVSSREQSELMDERIKM